jgi:hypothetical protein
MAKGQYLGVGEYPMDTPIKDAEGVQVGTYHPCYIDVYSEQAGLVRFSLDRSLSVHDPVLAAKVGLELSSLPLDLSMGEYVTLEGSFGNKEKIVRGESRDRNIKTPALTVSAVSRQLDTASYDPSEALAAA